MLLQQVISSIILFLYRIYRMASISKLEIEDYKKQILPREQRYKQLINNQQIPKTNESTIIIPCLTKTYGFKTNEYQKNLIYLEGAINKASFDHFVRKVNRVIQHQLIVKATKQNQPFFSIISVLLRLSIVIAILGFVLLAVVVYRDFSDSITKIITIVAAILISFSVIIAVLCPIFLYKANYEAHDFQQRIKSKLDALFKQQNRQNAANGKKYLTWNFQRQFFWIQLHIDRVFLSMHKGKIDKNLVSKRIL